MARKHLPGYHKLKAGTLSVMDEVARERAQRQTLEELADVPTRSTEAHSSATIKQPTSIPSKEK